MIKKAIAVLFLVCWFSIVLNKRARVAFFNSIKAMRYGPAMGLISAFILFGFPILALLLLVK